MEFELTAVIPLMPKYSKLKFWQLYLVNVKLKCNTMNILHSSLGVVAIKVDLNLKMIVFSSQHIIPPYMTDAFFFSYAVSNAGNEVKQQAS